MSTTTSILAVGNTAATSSEFEVESGAFVGLVAHGGKGALEVQIEAPDGAWVSARGINSSTDPATTIMAPGVYRVRRAAGQSVGAFITR